LRGKTHEYGEEFSSPVSSVVFTSTVNLGEMRLVALESGISIIKSPFLPLAENITEASKIMFAL